MTILRGDVPHLIESAAAILLDFDGPVCDVFANHPASRVADLLRSEIAGRGMVVPDAIAEESDPLAVVRWSASLADPSVRLSLDDRLVREELVAVETVNPSEGLVNFVHWARRSRPVVVVTNNSEAAVIAFIRRVGLEGMVEGISGRVSGRPDLMKPSPEPLLRAALTVRRRIDQCLMVGDSLTDLDAARAAGCATILLANKRRKEKVFLATGASGVVTSMTDLVTTMNS